MVGPLMAGVLCDIKILGSQNTMVIRDLLTMVLFSGYTAITSKSQNIGFSCTVLFLDFSFV